MRAAAALVLASVLVLAGCGGGEEAPRDRAPQLRRELGAAVRLGALERDPTYRRRFQTTFSLLVPENAMGWAFVEPRRGQYRWGAVDRLYAIARDGGKRVRGILVWDELLPDWLTRAPWEPAALGRVLDGYVERVARRYAARTDEWVVVNEPLADDGTLEPNLWLTTLGPDWIARAFRAARRADPHAELILNEIAAERGRKLTGLVTLARRLKREGVPVDAVGFQDHTDLAGAPSAAELERAFRRVAALGLDVYVTEADVEIREDPVIPADRRAQARVYHAVARACLAVRRCRGITVWGVTDRYSWKGAAAEPLLFDAGGRPKPALEGLLGALRR